MKTRAAVLFEVNRPLQVVELDLALLDCISQRCRSLKEPLPEVDTAFDLRFQAIHRCRN